MFIKPERTIEKCGEWWLCLGKRQSAVVVVTINTVHVTRIKSPTTSYRSWRNGLTNPDEIPLESIQVWRGYFFIVLLFLAWTKTRKSDTNQSYFPVWIWAAHLRMCVSMFCWPFDLQSCGRVWGWKGTNIWTATPGPQVTVSHCNWWWLVLIGILCPRRLQSWNIITSQWFIIFLYCQKTNNIMQTNATKNKLNQKKPPKTLPLFQYESWNSVNPCSSARRQKRSALSDHGPFFVGIWQ